MYDVGDQTGRRIVITGANSGTGKEAARRLAGAGADVVMAVRNVAKGEAARDEIMAEQPEAHLEIEQVDLASLGSVTAFAERMTASGRPLHVVINNAGVMAVRKRTVTEDGFELQLASNFLGPFALTLRVLPLLLNADRPRVVMMSSGAAIPGAIRFRDLQWQHGYGPYRAYSQSKLADQLMALRLGEIAEERGWPLRSTVAHPGITQTNLLAAQSSGRYDSLVERVIGRAAMTPQQGTEAMLYAAVDPAAEQGGYYGPTGRLGQAGGAAPVPRIYHRPARSADLARSLWAVAEDLTGVRLDASIGRPVGKTG